MTKFDVTSNTSPVWIICCGGPCEHISFHMSWYSEDKIETHHINDMRNYTPQLPNIKEPLDFL